MFKGKGAGAGGFAMLTQRREHGTRCPGPLQRVAGRIGRGYHGEVIALRDFSWERMIAAVEDVRERACRATAALKQAGIAHVVIDGNAVAAWVARVDKEAVRNTKDVDLLIRRPDLPRVIETLQSVGFVHHHVNGIDVFIDGPDGSVRSAIHVVFGNEQLRPDDPAPTPDVTEAEPGPDFPVPTLDALVRMKLTAFRLKDKVYLLDLLEVGLLDETWYTQLSPALAARLQEIIASREREA